MNLFVLVSVWALFFIWAAVMVQRIQPKSTSERVLWYCLMFSMPILGSLLVIVVARGRETAQKKQTQSLEDKMQAALIDAHIKAAKQEQ